LSPLNTTYFSHILLFPSLCLYPFTVLCFLVFKVEISCKWCKILFSNVKISL
jgi:hypothetical protein